jgi:DNA replicative helicase MCM subunit Mcm2 (Cdc46/Mcm family)
MKMLSIEVYSTSSTASSLISQAQNCSPCPFTTSLPSKSNSFDLLSSYRIRDLKANRIGKLMAISGTVTRTTEVRPELLYASFICMACNSEIKDIEQQFKYTEPKLCKNPNCKNHTKWELSVEGSIFGDWQKLRVQESSADIPTGGMPRSIDVVLRNEIVDQAKPGDRVIFVGTLVVIPDIVTLLKPGEKSQLNARGENTRKANTKPLVIFFILFESLGWCYRSQTARC